MTTVKSSSIVRKQIVGRTLTTLVQSHHQKVRGFFRSPRPYVDVTTKTSSNPTRCDRHLGRPLQQAWTPTAEWQDRQYLTTAGGFGAGSRHRFRKNTPSHSSTARETDDRLAIRLRGDHPYGTRQYLLVALAHHPDSSENTANTGPPLAQTQVVASVWAHRNLLFNASASVTSFSSSFAQTLLPTALVDAGSNGEQPQALATLDGLVEWIRMCFHNEMSSHHMSSMYPILENSDGLTCSSSFSQVLRDLHQRVRGDNPGTARGQWEALQKILVETNSPTNSETVVVDWPTWQFVEPTWKTLAREFVEQGNCVEASLYYNHDTSTIPSQAASMQDDDKIGDGRDQGNDKKETLRPSTSMGKATLVEIVHLAETKKAGYMQSAGGAMARFVFL